MQKEHIKSYVINKCDSILEANGISKTQYNIYFNNRYSKKYGYVIIDSHCRNYYTIGFNMPFLTHCAENGDVDDINEVILHELGHVLAGYGHGHDSYWKQQVLKIGGNPSRVFSNSNHKAYKYVYECPHCHEQVKKMRPVKKFTAHGKCCKELNNGKWSNKYVLKLVEVKEKTTI